MPIPTHIDTQNEHLDQQYHPSLKLDEMVIAQNNGLI